MAVEAAVEEVSTFSGEKKIAEVEMVEAAVLEYGEAVVKAVSTWYGEMVEVAGSFAGPSVKASMAIKVSSSVFHWEDSWRARPGRPSTVGSGSARPGSSQGTGGGAGRCRGRGVGTPWNIPLIFLIAPFP